eukprot:COSAG01_NODE_665_length_14398_cov_91.714595_11_plen_126_part_00
MSACAREWVPLVSLPHGRAAPESTHFILPPRCGGPLTSSFPPGAAVLGVRCQVRWCQVMPVAKKRRCLPVRRCWDEAAAATTLQALCRRRREVHRYLFALAEAAAATAVATEAAAVAAEVAREEE